MRDRRRRVVKAGLVLMLAGAPLAAAVPQTTSATPDAPVAIAQPLGAMTSVNPLGPTGVTLPEPGLLVLIGTALMGLASVVRRTTKT